MNRWRETYNGRASLASLLLLIHSQWLSGVTQSLWVSADGISLQYSLQAPAAFGICLQTSSPLLLPSNILWLFFFLPECPPWKSVLLFFPPLTIFTPDRRYDLQSQAKSCAVTAPPARHRTTSTDNLVPPHSPPSKNTSISTHRQTSTPLSKCH